jgi:hypothetical protein
VVTILGPDTVAPVVPEVPSETEGLARAHAPLPLEDDGLETEDRLEA